MPVLGAPGNVQTKFSRALQGDTVLMVRYEANVPLRRSIWFHPPQNGSGRERRSHACFYGITTRRKKMATTQVGSHTVYYDEFGAGHPLIFISGLGSTRLAWWKQIEPFAKKLRVINLDNRDAGDSALGTGPYTIADMAEDVAGVIKNLNLGHTHIVGISMGGMIAQELAIRHSELVDKLVLVATTAAADPPT
jgi:hypothetical protein